jgi:NADH-quinone oxidoreductase subunit F
MKKIYVGKGSCGLAAGAGAVYDAFARLMPGGDFSLHTTGCVGMCYLEPLVDVYTEGGKRKQTYVKVTPDMAEDIIAGRVPDSHKLSEGDAAVLNCQTRIALANCGIIDPEDITAYTAVGGYLAFTDALTRLSPEAVIDIIKTSGLAGRGGAGFPTWFKWNALRTAPGIEKYMVCNADEGDPGAFMDRAIIEGDPHAVIEGMLIGAYATGANFGVVYVRAEYPLAVQRLETAIAQARAAGFINAPAMPFDLIIKTGAGAFVCGEETALIASLEGERGIPRLKPPYPAQRGYRGHPTNINNVETYANVPWILRHGGEAFARMGTESSKGTKVFALTGKINRGGLAEIPMGTTLREVIFDIGGGIRGGKPVKAVQLGGPSGGCIPAELLDTGIDYKTLAATGAIMGSGGMVVMDDTACMVDMARYFLDFVCKESCGKCVHCRIGTKRMLEIVTRITQGEGRDGDIEKLEQLAQQVRDGALCGLGNTAPNPVLTTLKYFRHEYEEHIKDKYCAAGCCKALTVYRIDRELCRGCGLCAKKCPIKCIEGENKKPYIIGTVSCVKCGACAAVCPFGAVTHMREMADGEVI